MNRHTASLHARTLKLLDLTHTAVLQLIAHGPVDDLPAVTREPTVDEKTITRRGKDNDGDYTPTPRSPSARHGDHSDPTGNAVVAREATIQHAITIVEQLVTAAASTAARHMLTDDDRPYLDDNRDDPVPTDDVLAHINELGPDHANPIRTTNTGALVANVDPDTARYYLAAAYTYVTDVTDALHTRFVTSHDNDARAGIWDDQRTLHEHTHRAHRAATGIHEDPTEPPAPGQCDDPLERGCTRIVSDSDLERRFTTCSACRVKIHRDRRRVDGQ